MKISFFLFAALLATSALQAQEPATPAEKEAAYIRTVTARAEKIVSSLNLSDTKKAAAVTTIVADQYRALNAVYTARDSQVKEAKATLPADKEALQAKLKAIDEQTTNATKALHTSFLTRLSNKLTPEQVNQIKDGMTYNVLHVTYNGYNSMLPNLTAEQKAQIMTWLTEARENAMDAESSEKKHAWFGKYKGRINNYLSAAGYDLRKEGEDWQKRIAEERHHNKG